MDILAQILFASRTPEHPHQLLLLRVLGLRRRLVRIVCRVRCLVRISMWVQRLCVLRLPRRLLLLLRVLGLRRRRRHGQQQLRHRLVESRREWRALQVDMQERISIQVLHSFVLQTLLRRRQRLTMFLHPPRQPSMWLLPPQPQCRQRVLQ